jgi:hypothetical protein
MRPQKRRRTSGGEELHVAMEALTKATASSQSTPEIQLRAAGKDVASEGSTVITTRALRKRKERTNDSQNQKPHLGPLTAAQSELQDIASRPVAKLPARRDRQRPQHTILPIPSRNISIGQPLRDPELKIMDQVIRDAALHAQHFLKNPPKPLVDWTNGESTNDQDLDGVHVPHLHIDHSKEAVSSSEVVTIRDHEPDGRPRLTRNPRYGPK